MNRLTFGLATAVAGLVVVPNLASALSAVTTESTDLRAGPAFDFPVVDQIPSDVRVDVHGCVRGYSWCDVSWRDARGWVPGQELAYLYQDRRVTIVEYGPRIGLPIVGFSFDTYWDRYYRSRSWYGERARWRTVWRERERDDRTGDRVRDRREGGTESRRGTYGRQGDESERRLDRDRDERPKVRSGRDEDERRLNRRGSQDERPDVRTGRGDWRDRGETRGYRPTNPAPRQEMDRGTRGGGTEPGSGARDGGPGGQGGRDRGSLRQDERRP
jgi:uncharacterized protein YraI